ncbi:MAG: hypothetical protein KA131_05790, partial [Thauera sp.]|nr:hypothetical protein [Thauera sp.]
MRKTIDLNYKITGSDLVSNLADITGLSPKISCQRTSNRESDDQRDHECSDQNDKIRPKQHGCLVCDMLTQTNQITSKTGLQGLHRVDFFGDRG